VLIISLMCPVSLGFFLGVEVPASDIALALGAAWSLRYIAYARSFRVVLAPMVWGLAAWMIVTLVYSPPGPFQAMGSWLFAFRSFAALLIGSALAARGVRVERVVRSAAIAGSIVAVMVAAQLILGSEPHLDYGFLEAVGLEGQFLNGELLGRPLWARFGVNSLAGFYAIAFGICLAHTSSLLAMGSRRRAGELPVVVLGLVALAWLVLTSGSRQALVVVLLLMLTAAVIRVAPAVGRGRRQHSTRRFIALAVVLALGGLVLAGPTNPVRLSLSATMEQLGGGFTQISSGRDLEYRRALDEALEWPLTGTGFYGPRIDGAEDQVNAHNIVFGAGYRMGLIGAILLVLVLFRVLRHPASRLRSALMTGTTEPFQALADATLLLSFVVLGAVADVSTLPQIIAMPLLMLGVREVSDALQDASVAQARRRMPARIGTASQRRATLAPIARQGTDRNEISESGKGGSDGRTEHPERRNEN
jgi:O-antigen ligase